jgi:hypothetical protein
MQEGGKNMKIRENIIAILIGVSVLPCVQRLYFSIQKGRLYLFM